MLQCFSELLLTDNLLILMIFTLDGNYTEWSSYQRCSKSCGEGVQIRTRTCTNPPAMHGGKDCSHLGVASESKPCNEYKCDESKLELREQK